MAFSTPEGGSISTLINPTQGDEQFSVGELVIQEQEGSKVDEITDVVVTRKDELDDGHELPDHNGVGEEEIPVIRMSFGSLPLTQKFYANYAKKVGRNLRCSDDNEDFQRMMNYFVRMKEINPNFFYAIDVDDANKFRSTLWVDARCRVSYEYYEDVVSFDTTYRRNRHGLPFASFVGVNHHGKSTLLGCALLRSEEIPSFEWVFTQWVRCVETAPRGIITYQCKAMAGAIMKVLPDTIYRWYGELNAMMNHIVWNSPLTESFEADWAGFIKQFNLGHNIWLASMSSTQRSESMHTFYGGYLHCKSGLVQFVHEYDNGDTISIKVDEQKVFWGKPIYHTFRVEFDPLSRKGQCECNKFEFASILCCHTLAVWSYYRVDTVPSCYVLLRWSKNVIRKHTYIKNYHDVAQSDESNNLFRHLCSEFYNVAQEFLACDKEAAILQAAFWDAKFKLTDYRASMRSTTVATSQNTMDEVDL
ncbi:protein FAR1-RELATED SEQUENCE 5-like [Arachis duranensis]|uniref:Protein FAR1-RELATED SEQUENCE n=1 Tax=Arachis duranensis TaxID=130453 RepID=A0A6P5MSI8_ARADU|nr:protein FAR1-RELATED SEQUENCE 5-like [Arachis duranensis]XP_052112441.1 protein FAR1-RELATED SEQUENCE 5-like [Arachis duranensis]